MDKKNFVCGKVLNKSKNCIGLNKLLTRWT